MEKNIQSKNRILKNKVHSAVEPLIGEDGKKKLKKRTEDGGRSQTGCCSK